MNCDIRNVYLLLSTLEYISEVNNISATFLLIITGGRVCEYISEKAEEETNA